MEIIKNKLGYHEVADKPSDAELADYYANQYYQHGEVGYAPSYDDEELRFITSKLRQKQALLEPFLPPVSRQSLLDVGCGEGFTLPFFAEQGWEVLGIDFSEHAIKHHHPTWLRHFMAGDFRTVLRQLRSAGRQFSVLWLVNVLEHVRDPHELMVLCHGLAQPGGLILVDVPNDYSALQLEARASGLIDRDFWVALPDHLSYFNAEGLRQLAAAAGWEHCRTISGFPIDFNLFHPLGNYVMDKSTGKAAHRQRIRLDNLFTRISPEKTVALYEALAALGLGRDINSVFRKPKL